jgi:pyruvate dehydrogenase E2 component (dihydrolipoamide acetyltransferase)
MAMFEFRMPDIGEGVAEGEVVTWLVQPGQEVREDQEMVEVMTDKATVTIGAPKAGRIARLNASVGERVRVGSVLVVIETAAEEARPSRGPESDTALSRFQAPVRASTPNAPKAQVRPRPPEPPRDHPSAEKTGSEVVASAVGDIRTHLPGAQFFGRRASPESTGVVEVPRPLATPATRKLARDLGVDLRAVLPTGSHGRVTSDDVRAFTGGPVLGSAASSARELRKPFVGMRRRIAERMQTAKTKAAHFTFVEEAEVDGLYALVERLRHQTESRGIRLQILPFIVKAVTLALKAHPSLNSMLDEATNELVTKLDLHIGVATATDQGLMVPVVRHADRLSLLGIAQEIARLAEGARSHTLKPHELTGSTFTITSLGKLGGLLATPVLNHPEVGILGVHRMKERPVVRAGQIVIGKVLNLSLSFDHRIIDGHVGAAFAYEVIKYLETPELLLLEMA